MATDTKVPFTGNVTHKLDPKSRVAIPANWRAAQGDALVMIESYSEGKPILKCYTQGSFAEMIRQIREHAQKNGISPGDVNLYVGKVTGCSIEAELSSQGKLLIPKQQRERMSFSDCVTIVGRGDFFEIWTPEDFRITHSPEAMRQLQLDQIFRILS